MTLIADTLIAGVGGIVAPKAMEPVTTAIIGSSAPPQAYPLASHLRGLVGHLAYGLALAAAAEVGWLVLRRARGD